MIGYFLYLGKRNKYIYIDVKNCLELLLRDKKVINRMFNMVFCMYFFYNLMFLFGF